MARARLSFWKFVVAVISIITMTFLYHQAIVQFTEVRRRQTSSVRHQWVRPLLNVDNQPPIQSLEGKTLTNSPCIEKHHIVYLKSPKTASGTMSSILIQFGVSRNLTFALSKTGRHFERNPLSPADILPIKPSGHLDLLVHHSTYNRDTIRNVFPNDTLIITTLREPFEHFISSFYYFEGRYKVPIEVAISGDKNKQIDWYITNASEKRLKRTTNKFHGSNLFNLVSLKLGVPYTQSLNTTFVGQYLDSVLDKDIAFVVLQEYFDESLILLKRLLCWELRDMLYLRHHDSIRSQPTIVYREELIRKHQVLASAEYIIYDHFYKKFWKTLWKEGRDIFDEIRHFKGVLRRVQTFCNESPSNSTNLVISGSRWNDQFTFLLTSCQDLQRHILVFTNSQIKKQKAEIQDR